MLKAFKYRLLPTEEQKIKLVQWMGMCRFIYNLALEVKTRAWVSARINLSSFDLMKQVVELKATECPWLKDCNAQCLESSIGNLDKAYKAFFRGGGFPNFKKRAGHQSITFRRETRIDGNKIRLGKFGEVEFIKHRELCEGNLRTVVVSKTPANNYFVSILVDTGISLPPKLPIKEDTAVGIDVGLKTFAVLSDGQTFENPKYLHHQLKRLRIEQRTLARRYKKGVKNEEQSKGWHKQKLVVANLYEKIANQRKDFLHKTSTAIIKQFDTICLEDINVKGLLQNRNLSKAISDVSWSEFTRMLEYKAEWYGKNINRIGRFDPSSKMCSNCGHIKKDLKLSDREWDCEKCNAHHFRDQNAANNIKNFGLNVQPSTVKTGQQVISMGCENLHGLLRR